MGNYDEVIPDSQDEAELHTFDGRDSSPLSVPPPLTNATNSASSSSFLLPSPMAPAPLTAATSTTISQFTTPTEVIKVSSAISSFPTEPASSSPKKSGARPRPRPRPAFSGAKSLPKRHNEEPPLLVSMVPPTFSSGISERAKARRAWLVNSQDNAPAKATRESPLEDDVIAISSDESPRLLQKHKDSAHISPPGLHPCDAVPPLSSQHKRVYPNESGPDGGVAVSGALQPSTAAVSDAPRPKKKSKKGRASDAETGRQPSAQKSPREKKQKRKDKVPAKPRGSLKEKEQFKSREFIEDSDDELGLGAASAMESALPSAIMTVTPSDLVPKPVNSLASTGNPANPKTKNTEKEQFKSREFIEDSEDELSFGSPTSAPLRSSAVTVASMDKAAISSKCLASAEVETEGKTSAKTGSGKPGTSTKTASRKRKQREVSHDKVEEAAEGIRPPKKTKIVQEKTSEQPNSIPQDLIEAKHDTPKDNDNILFSKKKKVNRKIIEDEEDQDDAETTKENVVPIAKSSSASKPFVSPRCNVPPADIKKPSLAHPPKNRALSSILQLVNGCSPRQRASPSSRTSLRRIAPLHPNRRTPPPPPPRVVAKKTKKEIEREEKWEEELQETVPGWCELGEEERERMRREKRDWEMGVCEE